MKIDSKLILPVTLFRRFSIILLLTFVGPWLARGHEPVRLAVIAEAPELAALSDVLTAQLSADPQIHVLERAQIAKVYQEQALSAANPNYLKLGEILGADGLIVLEPLGGGGNKLLRSRLVAVKTGIILQNERFPLPSQNPAAWAPGFVNHLQPLLDKLVVSMQDAIPISIVSLRAAFQSPEEHELERNLTLLAGEALSREPRVFVLDRQGMQLLTAEKELQGAADSRFRNGSYLLDGTIDRDGYTQDEATLHANLAPPGRAPIPIQIRGPRQDPAGLARQLVRQILEQLNIKGAGKSWSASEEASQYETEARWAMRWGFFESAQAASESAWALGLHSRELKILRVQAYSDSLWPIPEYTTLVVPQMPDALWLGPITRALTLYCEPTPPSKINAGLDREWFEVGVNVLSRAAGVLDRFHEFLQLQQQNEAALAELRDLSRRTLLALDPPAAQADEFLRKFVNGRKVPAGLPYDDQLWRSYQRFSETRWNAGGLFFETPEAALPMFEAALKTIKIPGTLPPLAAWSWKDRQRIPGLMKQFCDDLRASTNEEIRLTGFYFSMLRAPNAPGSLEASITALEEEMERHRELIFTNSRMAPLFSLTVSALREKYGREVETPFADFRRNMRIDYLTNPVSRMDDNDILYSILPTDSGYYAKAEAQDLVPLLQELYQKNPADENLRRMMPAVAQAAAMQFKNFVPLSFPNYDHAASAPAAKTVVLKFLPWNLTPYSHRDNVRAGVRRMIYRDGKLWALLGSQMDSYFTASAPPAPLVEVNLETGLCHETDFPSELGVPMAGFDVTSNAVFVSLPGKLAWRPFDKPGWKTIPLQTQPPGEVLALQGRVYFANAENVLQITPETGAIEILAGSRRFPAVNELDRALGEKYGLFPGGDAELGIETSNHVFFFDLNRRSWKNIPLSEKSFPAHSTWFPSRGSTLLLSSRISSPNIAHRTLVQISPGQSRPELLLEQRASGTNTNPAGESPFGSTRWDWPQSFRLDIPSLQFKNDTLYVLQARVLQWAFRKSEPVQFHDDRTATLFRFKPGSRLPFFTPVAFEKNGKTFDPFALVGFGFSPKNFTEPATPDWLVTDKGIAIGTANNEPGHWFLSQAAIDSANSTTNPTTAAP